MHFTIRRGEIMYFCMVNLNSRAVSSDLHTKQRPLAAGFKAFYPTERTEHAAIARSDCAIYEYKTSSSSSPSSNRDSQKETERRGGGGGGGRKSYFIKYISSMNE